MYTFASLFISFGCTTLFTAATAHATPKTLVDFSRHRIVSSCVATICHLFVAGFLVSSHRFPQTILVSSNVCRFMIRQTKQQKFADKAIELCDEVVPSMILEAIVANVTTALCSIMTKLEDRFDNNPQWEEVTHMLRCPISQDYSTDLVKTPLNDHYYDRVQLLTWVRAKGTDPQTREPLQETDLLLRSEFLKEYALVLQQKIKELDKT